MDRNAKIPYKTIAKQILFCYTECQKGEERKGTSLMGVIVSVTNQKGGVGKTVTVSTLAAILTSWGRRVLAVDLDPQRNLDMSAGIDAAIPLEDKDTKSLLHVLEGKCSIEDAVYPCSLGDLVRASGLMTGWTGRKLITAKEYKTLPSEELNKIIGQRIAAGWGDNDAEILSDELAKVQSKYDYIFLDTNPSLQLLTTNALIACDYVLIPVFTEEASLSAVEELWDTICNINRLSPWKVREIAGILLTKYSPNRRISKAITPILEDMAQQMETIVFKQTIRQGASVSEYLSNHETLLSFDKTGPVTKDYLAFATEFETRIQELEGE